MRKSLDSLFCCKRRVQLSTDCVTAETRTKRRRGRRRGREYAVAAKRKWGQSCCCCCCLQTWIEAGTWTVGYVSVSWERVGGWMRMSSSPSAFSSPFHSPNLLFNGVLGLFSGNWLSDRTTRFNRLSFYFTKFLFEMLTVDQMSKRRPNWAELYSNEIANWSRRWGPNRP